MFPRILTPALAVLTVIGILVAAVAAAESTDGTIEKAGSGKITVKMKDGTMQTYAVDAGAKITLDGKTADLGDLPMGGNATVTTETKNNKTVAVTIIARSKM